MRKRKSSWVPLCDGSAVARFTRLTAKGRKRRTPRVLVIDTNASELVPAFDARYSCIAIPSENLDSDQIIQLWLPNRVLVTRNAKNFLGNAVRYDYGIISLDGLDLIDIAPELAANIAAKYIDHGYKKYKLARVRTRFLLEIKNKQGKPMTRKDVSADVDIEGRARLKRKTGRDARLFDQVQYVFRRLTK